MSVLTADAELAGAAAQERSRDGATPPRGARADSSTDDPSPGHQAGVSSVTALLSTIGPPIREDAHQPGPHTSPVRARGSQPPPIPMSARRPTTPPPAAEIGAPPAVLEFTGVYDEHFAFVWRSMRRLGVPDRLLDDAAQDVFIVVHRRLAEFEGRSSLKSWLFAIARRVAHDHRRRIGRKERTEELPETLVDPRSVTPAHDAERAQAVRTLHEILGSMDDDKREVFVLAELEQMTVPEIADAIGANVNTVYSRLRVARTAFDQAVQRWQARQHRAGDRP